MSTVGRRKPWAEFLEKFSRDVSVIFPQKMRKSRAYKVAAKFNMWLFILVCVLAFSTISWAYFADKYDQQTEQYAQLTEKYNKAEDERQNLHNCLMVIAQNAPLYDSNVQSAYAYALLITDAYQSGGLRKSQEVYNGFLDQVGIANGYYLAVTNALKNCGIPFEEADKSPESI